MSVNNKWLKKGRELFLVSVFFAVKKKRVVFLFKNCKQTDPIKKNWKTISQNIQRVASLGCHPQPKDYLINICQSISLKM